MKVMKCHCCGKDLGRESLKYIVEIKSFADFDGYLEEYPGDVEDGINELLDAVENVDPRALEDEVYQEYVYLLCKSCRDKFASDPFQTGFVLGHGEEAKGTVH